MTVKMHKSYGKAVSQLHLQAFEAMALGTCSIPDIWVMSRVEGSIDEIMSLPNSICGSLYIPGHFKAG